MKRILSTVLTLSVMLVSCIMTTGCEKNGGNGNGNEGEYGFTKSDAILAFDSFISNFFESRGQFARDTNMDGTTAVAWTQATMFDMIINAYKLTDDQKYMDLLNKHFEGCKNTFTFDWYDYSHWDLYDDMMWWVGALARAYQLTGNEEFLSVSEEGFKRVWYGKESNFDGKGWDELDAYGSFGGDDDTQIPGKPLTAIPAMYWDWKFARTGKMSCVHFPTMIAAITVPGMKITSKKPRLCTNMVPQNFSIKRPGLSPTQCMMKMQVLTGDHLYITRLPQWRHLPCFILRPRNRNIWTTP